MNPRIFDGIISICVTRDNIRKEPVFFMTDKLENEVLEETVPEEEAEKKPKNAAARRRSRKRSFLPQKRPSAKK